MLMCRCNNCRGFFDPENVATYREDYGEIMHGCPYCFGDYDELYVCDECETVMVLDDDSGNWVCPECGKEEF